MGIEIIIWNLNCPFRSLQTLRVLNNNMWTKDSVDDDILEQQHVGMGIYWVLEGKISKFCFKIGHELLLVSQAGQFSSLRDEQLFKYKLALKCWKCSHGSTLKANCKGLLKRILRAISKLHAYFFFYMASLFLNPRLWAFCGLSYCPKCVGCTKSLLHLGFHKASLTNVKCRVFSCAYFHHQYGEDKAAH